MTEPLIFTTKGNLPISSLTHEVEWRIEPERVVFIETYKLDGEIVKQSSHIKILSGVAALSDVGKIGA